MFARWWLRNDRNRLMLGLALILTLSFVGVSTFNYLATREAIHQEIVLQGLPLTRDNIYSELSGELMRPLLVSSSMANDTFLQDWAQEGERDQGRIIRYLYEIHDKYGFFSTFFVSAKTNNYYHYKGLHKVISEEDDHDVWFYRFVQSGEEYALVVDTDEAADNILSIFINFRVTAPDGELLGVTGVGLRMDAVASMITSYQEKYDRSIYLVDTNGVIQVHPNQGMIMSVLTRQIGPLGPPLEDLLRTRDEPENFQFERDGRDILLTVRYVPELKWIIFVEQDETKALAMARRNFLRTVLIGLLASVCIIGMTLAAINRYQRRVERMAVSDELTGALNRRGLENAFVQAMYVQKRYERPCSLIILDLDGFKAVNDHLGHLAGDQVLLEVTRRIKETIRPSDVFARWGGDEFVVLTENRLEQAALLAERIRKAIHSADLADQDAAQDDPRRAITICCGVTLCRGDDDLDQAIRRADQAMYLCKAEGGDGVRSAG